jgi:hypothetical protein
MIEGSWEQAQGARPESRPQETQDSFEIPMHPEYWAAPLHSHTE